MRKSIFLSYPKSINDMQKEFISKLTAVLHTADLEPRTLGITDYDTAAPLLAIRRLMLESYGIITIAFRRTHVNEGVFKPGTPQSSPIKDRWFTSPYCQIEPAMAFQMGLPLLVLREEGVLPDGILERGVLGTYMPEFDLNKPGDQYLDSREWRDLFKKWERQVFQVYDKKAEPPNLYTI